MSEVVVKPYQTSQNKKQEVRDMFNNISPRYDFLNRFLSLGIDIYWRNFLIKKLKTYTPSNVLDLATGTADLAIGIAKETSAQVIGLDISDKMIEQGRVKVLKKQLNERISLVVSDGENLPFQGPQFDAITISFGIRNYENMDRGLQEMYRVLNAGGNLYVLEFSMPDRFPIKQLYTFYFKYVLPSIGRLISKDPKAYAYLFESVQHFPYGEAFVKKLKDVGFKHVISTKLSFGIVTLYQAYS